jgi:hypothetical protein
MSSFIVPNSSMRRIVLAVCGLAVAGCGHSVNPGVAVNTIGVSKRLVGRAAADAPFRGYAPDSTRKRRVGDVAGDAAPDEIVEDARHQTLTITSARGAQTTFTTGDYISDFAVVRKEGEAKRRLVVHTYPNVQKGSTFTAFAPADNRILAAWNEFPPASRGVAGGTWRGRDAVFYMVRDDLVIRTVEGEPLERLTIPGINSFSDVYVDTLANDRTVLVLSGDGYTPYHAILVLGADGAVVYHERAAEHAFGLKAIAGHTFQVETRSQIWEFQIPGT